jgi:hypothetical protein
MPEQNQNKPKIISIYFYPPPYELFFRKGPARRYLGHILWQVLWEFGTLIS